MALISSSILQLERRLICLSLAFLRSSPFQSGRRLRRHQEVYLWEFINSLKKMEMQARALMQLQLSEENVSNRRLCQRKKENRICTMVNRYDQGLYPDDLTYIRELAHLQADFIDHGEEED